MKQPEPSRIRLSDPELDMLLNAIASYGHPTFENKAQQKDYDRMVASLRRKLERSLAKIR